MHLRPLRYFEFVFLYFLAIRAQSQVPVWDWWKDTNNVTVTSIFSHTIAIPPVSLFMPHGYVYYKEGIYHPLIRRLIHRREISTLIDSMPVTEVMFTGGNMNEWSSDITHSQEFIRNMRLMLQFIKWSRDQGLNTEKADLTSPFFAIYYKGDGHIPSISLSAFSVSIKRQEPGLFKDGLPYLINASSYCYYGEFNLGLNKSPFELSLQHAITKKKYYDMEPLHSFYEFLYNRKINPALTSIRDSMSIAITRIKAGAYLSSGLSGGIGIIYNTLKYNAFSRKEPKPLMYLTYNSDNLFTDMIIVWKDGKEFDFTLSSHHKYGYFNLSSIQMDEINALLPAPDTFYFVKNARFSLFEIGGHIPAKFSKIKYNAIVSRNTPYVNKEGLLQIIKEWIYAIAGGVSVSFKRNICEFNAEMLISLNSNKEVFIFPGFLTRGEITIRWRLFMYSMETAVKWLFTDKWYKPVFNPVAYEFQPQELTNDYTKDLAVELRTSIGPYFKIFTGMYGINALMGGRVSSIYGYQLSSVLFKLGFLWESKR